MCRAESKALWLSQRIGEESGLHSGNRAVDNSLYNYLNAEKETAAAFNTPRSRIVAITISIKMITILENM